MAKAVKKVTRKKSTISNGNALSLTERDLFASEALMGLLSSRTQHPLPKLTQEADQLAALSYVIADQMLEMRMRDGNQLKSYIALKTQQQPAAQAQKAGPPQMLNPVRSGGNT